MDSENIQEDVSMCRARKRPLENIENTHSNGEQENSSTYLCSRRRLYYPQSKENQLTNDDVVCRNLNVSRSVNVQRIPWTVDKDTALVQFFSLYKDEQLTYSVWPAMKSYNQYWTKAAKFIQESVGSASPRIESSIRQRVVNVLRVKYNPLEEAEMNFGLSIDAILQGGTATETPSTVCPASFLSKLRNLTARQLVDVTNECLQLLQPQHLANVLSENLLRHADIINMESVIMPTFTALAKEAKFSLMDQMFADLSYSVGVNTKLSNFISLSVEAMKVLQNAYFA